MPEAAEETGPFRVRDSVTGHEYTTSVVFEGQTKIDEPAIDESGRWLPAKINDKPAKAASKEGQK